MFRNRLLLFIAFITVSYGCLITNCPRGGKRSHLHHETNIKQCISCGPNHTGQCFGPNICCGPFGCLMGTKETVRCQREGLFFEPEPCMAGSAFCRKNTGRCAGDGICCTQDSCHTDKSCIIDDKQLRPPQDMQLESLYNIFSFPNQIDYGNEMLL